MERQNLIYVCLLKGKMVCKDRTLFIFGMVNKFYPPKIKSSNFLNVVKRNLNKEIRTSWAEQGHTRDQLLDSETLLYKMQDVDWIYLPLGVVILDTAAYIPDLS